MKRRWFWIQLILAVAIITVAAVQFLDLGRMGALLSAISLPLFLATLAVAAADQTLMGLKWHLLLKIFGVSVKLRIPVYAYWRGRFLRLAAPSVVGLDAYRAYYVKRQGASLVSVLSSIFVERFFGMLSSVAMIALLFPLALERAGVAMPSMIWAISGGGFLATWGLVWLALRWAHLPGRRERVRWVPQRFQEPCLRFLRALGKLQDERARVFLYFAISCVEKLFYGTCVYFAALALGVHGVGWLYFIAAIPVVALLERLPITFNAIGVREGLFVAVLQPFSIDQNVAVSVGLVVRAAEIVLVLISLLSWIPRSGRGTLRSRLKEVSEEVPEEKAPTPA